MATPSELGVNPKLPTWDGDWRTYADFRLACLLEKVGLKEEDQLTLAPRLARNLTGKAWEACADIDRAELRKKEGLDYLLKYLKEKRGKQQVDILGEAFEKYFQSGDAIRQDRECLTDFEQRVSVHFRDIARALQEMGTSVEVPSEIYGWFLLNKHIRLEPSDVATLKSQTASYKLADVWKALRKMWGGDSLVVKDQERKKSAKAYMAVEEYEDEDGDGAGVWWTDPEDDGALEPEDEEATEIWFEEALEALQENPSDEVVLANFNEAKKAFYKDARKALDQSRVNRGFYPNTKGGKGRGPGKGIGVGLVYTNWTDDEAQPLLTGAVTEHNTRAIVDCGASESITPFRARGPLRKTFVFGNNESSQALGHATVTAGIHGREQKLGVHVVEGQTPLLLSGKWLYEQKAIIDFGRGQAIFPFLGQEVIQLERAATYHLLMPVTAFEGHDKARALTAVAQDAAGPLLRACAQMFDAKEEADSPLATAVEEAGGHAYRMGLHSGYDLATKAGLKKGTGYAPEEAEQLKQRAHGRLILRSCLKLIQVQRQELQGESGMGPDCQDTHVGGEQPLSAASWKEPSVKLMVRLCGGERFRIEDCRYGAETRCSGFAIQKGWLSSSPEIREALDKVGRHEHERASVAGRAVAETAVYPQSFCRSFAKVLMKSRVDRCMTVQNHPEEPSQQTSELKETKEPQWNPSILKEKLRVIHANLGHPSNQVLVRMLKDARASEDLIKLAANYECHHCAKRGHANPHRTAQVPHATRKWEVVSVDTFWWHSPHKDAQGNPKEHVLGVSWLDEASDFHTALGAFRDSGLLDWIEAQAIKVSVIAGEAAWQVGKHSRHLEVLKENMSLLSLELGPNVAAQELLELCLASKNEMHQDRRPLKSPYKDPKRHEGLSCKQIAGAGSIAPREDVRAKAKTFRIWPKNLKTQRYMSTSRSFLAQVNRRQVLLPLSVSSGNSHLAMGSQNNPLLQAFNAKVTESQKEKKLKAEETERERCLNMDLKDLAQEKITVGKYKGRTVQEASQDPSYVKWLLEHQEDNTNFIKLIVYNEKTLCSVKVITKSSGSEPTRSEMSTEPEETNEWLKIVDEVNPRAMAQMIAMLNGTVEHLKGRISQLEETVIQQQQALYQIMSQAQVTDEKAEAANQRLTVMEAWMAEKKCLENLKFGCFEWQRASAEPLWESLQEKKPRRITYAKEQPGEGRDLEVHFSTALNSSHEVIEIALDLQPRDVHKINHRGSPVWVLNDKPKRRAEVQFRHLEDSDKLDFMKAMQGELSSYLEHEAVAIAKRHNVPAARVMGMRWVLSWKAVTNEQGEVTGQKPKARLIIKGYQELQKQGWTQSRLEPCVWRLYNTDRYAEGINEIPLSKVRKEQPELEVTEDERKQFRAALGALSWRATQSAPWLAASVSYLQGCHKAAKVGDLIQANKLIRMQRIYSQQTLYFPSEISEPVLLTYHDASYACRRDGSSQGGVFTMLVDKCVLAGKVGKYSPLGWQSRKLPRICRSSTAAEIQTGSHAMDTHEFTKQLLLEWYNQQVIDYKDMDKALRRFQSVVVTDSKNLYDSVHRIETSGLQLEERRLALEVLSIRERIKSAGMHFKWVDSDQQLADNLSKPFSFQTLLTAIHKGELCLQFHSQFVSAKKKRAWKNKTRSKVDSDSDEPVPGKAIPLELNLASLSSVRAFASQWSSEIKRPIDILACNAGLALGQDAKEPQLTTDGYELTVGTNHLGHFLLVNLLESQLAATARIVVTASSVHNPKTGDPGAQATLGDLSGLYQFGKGASMVDGGAYDAQKAYK
ncbi:PORB, partial [Symbiodinium natans]